MFFGAVSTRLCSWRWSMRASLRPFQNYFRGPQILAGRHDIESNPSCRWPPAKYFASLCSSCRVLHEIAQPSEASVQFFLGRYKFLCRSPTTIPMGSGPIVGVIRLPLRTDGLHARISQVITQKLVRSLTITPRFSRQACTSCWQRAWCC